MNNSNENNEVLKQDLSKEEHQSTVFPMILLFNEVVEMPKNEEIEVVMNKYFGEVVYNHGESGAMFSPQKFKSKFKDGEFSPNLIIANPDKTDGYEVDVMVKSQMWDCPNRDEVLGNCKSIVFATDMLAAGLEYKERAEMSMDYMEALAELFPTFTAIYFPISGKLMPHEQIINHDVPKEKRFIYFAVNVRFFNIQGTNDALIDTLGMSTLFLHDLQYHFHLMEPNWVVNHAYNLLYYIFDHDCPIKSGETVAGITNGNMDGDVVWRCQFENSLIQPARELMDICMGEYASGDRE